MKRLIIVIPLILGLLLPMSEFRPTFPDWLSTPGQLGAPQIDLAELAARTGSVSKIRRTGKVIYSDDFSDLSGWSPSASGAGGKVEITSDFEPYSPPGQVKLTPGADVNKSAEITKRFPLLDARKVGIELLFKFGITSPNLTIDIARYPLNGQAYLASVKYISIYSGLYYADSGGTFRKIMDVIPGNKEWVSLKMVIDFENFLWGPIYVNEKIFQFDAGIWPFSGTGYRFEADVYADDPTGNQSPAYIDDYILTIDEP